MLFPATPFPVILLFNCARVFTRSICLPPFSPHHCFFFPSILSPISSLFLALYFWLLKVIIVMLKTDLAILRLMFFLVSFALFCASLGFVASPSSSLYGPFSHPLPSQAVPGRPIFKGFASFHWNQLFNMVCRVCPCFFFCISVSYTKYS